ncbi:Fpg/Nei family DNA glycosylase [Knoellia locipacati]|uniref:DNA-(apurinic or apyrimidinic site) lyase n=1 Tax=Knoellia locipacati TaxID=882824 RepID=A0A512SYQ4_9MICO|nr:zinc finger domain-containing protein [Knoellia locipacati]GEQ13093.1 endonuclease 8 1 [Knoellia locipacati]
MAEGHAVHGMAGRLRQLAGQPVRSSSPNGALDAALFDERVVADAQAVGKHLLVSAVDVPLTVHLHLAMDGAVSVRRHARALAGAYPRTEPPIHGNVAWRLLSATHHAEVTDPAVCELLDEDGVLALRARLGPDPLRDDADPDLARRRIQNSRRPIGALLIDQKVIAGIGNVYRAELLHRARLDPFTPGHDIDDDTFAALWQDAVDLMTLGLGAGWIVTDEAQMAAAREVLVRGERVPRWPKRYAVYGRAGKPCPVCGTTVRAERMGLQRLFWCPGCQHS